MGRIAVTWSLGWLIASCILFMAIPLTSSVLTFYGPRVNCRGLKSTKLILAFVGDM